MNLQSLSGTTLNECAQNMLTEQFTCLSERAKKVLPSGYSCFIDVLPITAMDTSLTVLESMLPPEEESCVLDTLTNVVRALRILSLQWESLENEKPQSGASVAFDEFVTNHPVGEIKGSSATPAWYEELRDTYQRLSNQLVEVRARFKADVMFSLDLFELNEECVQIVNRAYDKHLARRS